MANLQTAAHQWATRPDDERFTSLTEMADHFRMIREQSRAVIAPSRKLSAVPQSDHKGLAIQGPAGNLFAPTNWAFGQLASLVGAPAGYLRTLPSDIAADAINYGLQFKREAQDVGVLLQSNGTQTVRAVTGPNYGRIWNEDVITALVDKFGNGVDGQWVVPGEFGNALTEVTKSNTTLYASDRDMFVFLCDERHRIELPNRRNGETGTLARGFFVWNSEVGKSTYGLATFLFDFVCMNRHIWGGEQFAEFTLRHTASAPGRFLEEVGPALNAYANASARSITDGIQKARQAKLSGSDGSLEKFLTSRFGKRAGDMIAATHQNEEGRPIENLWDVATGVTAYARGLTHQDARIDLERKAGSILALAAK